MPKATLIPIWGCNHICVHPSQNEPNLTVEPKVEPGKRLARLWWAGTGVSLPSRSLSCLVGLSLLGRWERWTSAGFEQARVELRLCQEVDWALSQLLSTCPPVCLAGDTPDKHSSLVPSGV